MKRNTIQNHFLRYYGVFAFALFIVLTLFVNTLFRLQYQKAAIEKRQQENEAIVALFNQKVVDDKLEDAYINGIAEQLLQQGVVLMLEEQGMLVYCVSCMDGNCNQMMEQMHQKINGYFPWANNDYHEAQYLLIDGRTIAIFAHYGEFTLLESDIEFLKQMNLLLFGVGALGTIGFVLLAIYSSKKVSEPLQSIIHDIQHLEEQNMESKTMNITELVDLQEGIRQLQRRLQYQSEFQERLNRDLAHELRTPLAILQTTIEALQEGIIQVDEKYIASLHEEIIRLSTLVQKVENLHLSKTEINKTNGDVKVIIEELVPLLEIEAKKKNVEIKVDVEEGWVMMDSNQMKQVFLNGMSNAIKYSYENKNIEWNGFTQEDSYIVEIIDYGMGIEAKDLPFVFEYLYRSDNSRTRASGGQGIGLSIVKKIVEGHQGTVKIESNNEKTILTIQLPLT